MKFLSSTALTAAALAMASPSMAAQLVTPDDSSNGANGIMFDVQVGASGVTFQSLETDIRNAGTYTFEFYTIDGGIAGNESNAAAWTLRDTFSNVATLTEFTSFDISDFFVGAGSTIGFFITTTGATSSDIAYTNGSGVGNVRASDANIAILEGFGKANGFGSTFQPRALAGSITYAVGNTTAVPEPGTWLLLLMGFFGIGAAMRHSGRANKVSVSYS